MSYRQSDISKLDGKRKLHTAISAAVAAATVVACVLLCVFADHDNKTAMMIAACVIATLGGWTMIADVYLAVLPSKYRARRLSMLLKHEPENFDGTVSAMTHVTVGKWVSAYEIKLTAADGKIDTYMFEDELFPTLEFGIGDKISGVAYDKFVSEVEVCRE